MPSCGILTSKGFRVYGFLIVMGFKKMSYNYFTVYHILFLKNLAEK